MHGPTWSETHIKVPSKAALISKDNLMNLDWAWLSGGCVSGPMTLEILYNTFNAARFWPKPFGLAYALVSGEFHDHPDAAAVALQLVPPAYLIVALGYLLQEHV